MVVAVVVVSGTRRGPHRSADMLCFLGLGSWIMAPSAPGRKLGEACPPIPNFCDSCAAEASRFRRGCYNSGNDLQVLGFKSRHPVFSIQILCRGVNSQVYLVHSVYEAARTKFVRSFLSCSRSVPQSRRMRLQKSGQPRGFRRLSKSFSCGLMSGRISYLLSGNGSSITSLPENIGLTGSVRRRYADSLLDRRLTLISTLLSLCSVSSPC